MNILIFSSATNARICEELAKMNLDGEDDIYLLVSKSRAEYFRNNYKNIRVLEFDKTYISYKYIKSVEAIPRLVWDVVIVPSSVADNIYGFGEIYALMTEMKYRRMLWKGSTGMVLEKKNTIWERLGDGVYSFAAFKMYKMIVFLEQINSLVHGYKW